MTKQNSKSLPSSKSLEFKATTTYTFEEFQRFSKVVAKKQLRKCDLIVILTYLAIAIVATIGKNYQAIAIYLLIIPIMLIFSRLFLRFGFKRIWKSNPEAHNLATTFTFRINSFRQKNNISDRTTKYDELRQIIETNTNFYLMVKSNQGSLVNKKDCSPELINFLQNRAKELKSKQWYN